MRVARRIIGMAGLAMERIILVGIATVLLTTAPVMVAQAPSALTLGENTKMNAGGLVSFGYAGDYGDAIPSDHGLTAGLDGKLSGYYYNPNFLNFSATPYYNQSRSDSSYQSLTGASGIDGTANFFTGSNFPGSVSYHYDRNSSGTFGLTGQPNFTTIGKGEGFGINWSALLPGLPTLSVGYSQGDGSGTIYGTNEETSSDTKLFQAHSNYSVAGFRLNAFYTHNTSELPISGVPDLRGGIRAGHRPGKMWDLGRNMRCPSGDRFTRRLTGHSSEGSYGLSGQSPSVSSFIDDSENAGCEFPADGSNGDSASTRATPAI